MIRRFFSPPVFADENDNFRAKFINGFAWATIAILAIAIIPHLRGPIIDYTAAVLSGLIMMLFGSVYLLHRKYISASGYLIIIVGWLGLGIQAYTADGVKDVVIIAYIALGLLASIVVSWQAGGIVILTSLATIWALAELEAGGYLTARVQDPIGYARDLSLIFLSIAVLVYFSTTSLRDAIRRINRGEEGLRISNQNLLELNQSLEDRVARRTAELEEANQRNERRARQFEAIAQFASVIATDQSLETLLPNLVELISRQFAFYHVGIFLLDQDRQYAELRAANSEGGRHMLARGHKLAIGQSGIVGYVSATGRARIALDVGDDAVYFNNPDLPSTRSEMALPLRLGGQVIGVLDVQSMLPNAFQEEDTGVLATLADQVSIAIQNAQTFERTRSLLEESQRASGAFLRESWHVLQSQQSELIGVRLSENRVEQLGRPISSAHIARALASKQTVMQDGERATLSIPIRIREDAIGILDIRTPDEHEWEADEVDVAEAVAERLSLALESSLLLKSTQRRAEIERITTDISSKLGSSTQFDSILRTAAEELSRVLGGSEVLVQLQSGMLEEPTDE